MSGGSRGQTSSATTTKPQRCLRHAAAPPAQPVSACFAPLPPFVLRVVPPWLGAQARRCVGVGGGGCRWLLRGDRGAGLLLAHGEAKTFCPNRHLAHKGDLVALGWPAATRLQKTADVPGLFFAIANTSAELPHLLPLPNSDTNPFPHRWASALRMVLWETGGFPVPPCPR